MSDFDFAATAVYRALLEQGRGVHLLVDPGSARILDVGGPLSRLLGFPPEKLRGQPLARLRPSSCPPHLAVLGPLQLQDAGTWEEVALASADGGVRICSVEVIPIKEQGGRLLLLRLADVTGRAELQQQMRRIHARLQQAYRDLEQNRARLEEHRRASSLSLFAAGLAHELNNPLSVVISNLSSVAGMVRDLSGKPDPSLAGEIEQTMRECNAALERVAGIVELLRELEHQPHPVPLELVSWLQRQGNLAEVPGNRPRRLQVTSDPQLIQRIIHRLLDNARRAAGPGGNVTLELAGDDGHFTIGIIDDGPGMEAAVLERACDPFFTTRPPGQGLGLGLFLARRAAVSLGGELELQSVAGHGCRATVRLPRDSSSHTGQAVSYENFRTGAAP